MASKQNKTADWKNIRTKTEGYILVHKDKGSPLLRYSYSKGKWVKSVELFMSKYWAKKTGEEYEWKFGGEYGIKHAFLYNYDKARFDEKDCNAFYKKKIDKLEQSHKKQMREAIEEAYWEGYSYAGSFSGQDDVMELFKKFNCEE